MEEVCETFSVRPGAVAQLIMRRWVGRWWWIAGLIFVGTLVLALGVSNAFWYVGAMVVFILFPMVLSIVYFNYCLKPSTARCTLRQRLTVGDDRISVDFLYPAEDDKLLIKDTLTIPKVNIREIIPSGDNIAIVYGSAPDSFILVPVCFHDALEKMIAKPDA